MSIKISELGGAGTLSGAEEFPVVQGGALKKATIADIGGLLGEGLILVASALVSGSPIPSISFTGLDLDSAGKYVIYAGLVNGTGSNGSGLVYFNGDTTSGNYFTTYIVGYNGGVAGGTTAGTTGPGVLGSSAAIACASIFKDPDGYTRYLGMINTGSSTSLAQAGLSSCRWNNVANVTRIDFTGPTNFFGVGSWIKLYKQE